MNNLAQWIVDVGLLHERDVAAGRWWKVRPRFWHTSSNRIHRTYREVIEVLTEVLTEAAIKDAQAAYIRGAKDGALQLAETIHQEETRIDARDHYVH